ncbi:TRAP transporter small permease [Pollutimonas bauzanensis]|uniref:TRAP transporter small permease protein n=1 Tax=Pollutimonas bauzanensis TaxID=658167 RepID=A0A1M5VFU7_9BURK|nr:TRAP transporter small permease [Pollutimonas bauzanensis]SHH74045.1 TRAP-type C4-dicarboxylate transport system, small permease component [Pollutimonas bauzanensis]
MRYINGLAQILVTMLFAAMVLVGSLQVFNRFFFNVSLSWSEELQKYTFIWLVFIAIPLAYNRMAHLRVDSLVGLFPAPLQRFLELFSDVLWVLLGIALVLLTWRIMQVTQYQQSPGLGISMSWVYCGMLVGGAYLVLSVVARWMSRIKSGEPS